MWEDYAPDLAIVGAVAGAVPADLGLTARFLDGGPYFAFLGYAIAGLAEDYGIDLAKSRTLTRDGRSVSRILREEPSRPRSASSGWARVAGRRHPRCSSTPATHAAAALTSYPAAFAFLHGRFTGMPMRANTARYLQQLAEEPVLEVNDDEDD